MSPQQYLAREYGYLGEQDRLNTSSMHSQMKQYTNKISENAKRKSIQDEDKGVMASKVSSSMIDLEDIIYNK